MTNNTIEAYLKASSSTELNELPLTRSGVDCTSNSIEAQMDALVELLAEAQLTYGDSAPAAESDQIDVLAPST